MVRAEAPPHHYTHTTDQISRVHSRALWGPLDCLWNTLTHSETLWLYLDCSVFSGVTLEIVPTLWSVLGTDFIFSLSCCHVMPTHGLPCLFLPCHALVPRLASLGCMDAPAPHPSADSA